QAVVAACGEEPATGREGDLAATVGIVGLPLADHPAGGHLPQADTAVLVSQGREGATIGGEGQGVDALVAALDEVPEAGGAEAGGGTGRQGVAGVRRERHGGSAGDRGGAGQAQRGRRAYEDGLVKCAAIHCIPSCHVSSSRGLPLVLSRAWSQQVP